MRAENILVVDDEPGVREALEDILRDEGYIVATAGSGEEGLEALEVNRFDAVLLDVWLPGIDGLETLIRLRRNNVDSEVIMISGHGTIETAVRATKLGAFDFVEKPLSLERMLLVLRNALRQRRLEKRNRRLLEQLSRDTEILGTSPASEKLRADVAAAATSEAPVLICGERGSGRETVARRIHSAGRRSGESFVDIPCGALDEHAAAVALFGSAEQPGRLPLAEGGILFLDDVESLDASIQRRLAATLDVRSEAAPNVRLLASGGTEPAELEPSLRQLLEVVRIDVPPLRERREDIPLMAGRFIRDLSREYGRGEKRLSPQAMAALQAHSWPGNVRELHNLIERLLLLPASEELTLEELPEDLGGPSGPSEDLYREFESLAEGVESFERYYVRRVLTEERGDLAGTASRLGMSTQTLESRIKTLGIA
jgi:two-component system nitrogen regulation response regulator NtrX